MRTAFQWKFILVIILMVVLGLFFFFDQGRAGDRGFGYGVPQIGPSGFPTIVQFVGTFYTPEEKAKAAGMNTLTLVVDKKEWLFKIKNAIDLSGDRTELGILNDIWPARLVLRGPKNLIDPLQKPDIAGTTVLKLSFV